MPQLRHKLIIIESDESPTQTYFIDSAEEFITTMENDLRLYNQDFDKEVIEHFMADGELYIDEGVRADRILTVDHSSGNWTRYELRSFVQ